MSDLDGSVADLLAEVGPFAPDETITLDVVATMLRAAYGAGYIDALSDPEPMPILPAWRRWEALRLRLPVQ